ncbi:3-keto-disaccharide hydrolase [Pelagicoccus mobilis]|uniref:DUF1080 domain-containing protein n=1 Tax=Pelagicoccus mobilis TaxID=415221 RepID=A0A934VNE0_9BACT|nr:DUF1080 domain-containing protein [Pelagicoccus mobilis]MBK1879846.1 DUF1080 domain-containing protein [Pelagicoccus mobilis]
MKATIPSILLAFLLSACSSGPDLKPIFNGENLEGWVANREEIWTVADGVLTATNDPDQKGDILFTTKNDYRSFILELDFKFGEGRIDSGVFLRDNKEQIQIGESGSLKRDMTALPYIPGKGYPIQVETAQTVLEKTDWNTLRIEVNGSSYTTWLNGTEIMTYESETIVPRGPIGLQLHPKREMSISFRNILATELPE